MAGPLAIRTGGAWAWNDGLFGRVAKGTEEVFWAATVHAGMAVDDVTFSDLEIQWPFPRSYYAKVADRLQALGDHPG